MIHVYRATRGKYAKPIHIGKAKIRWVDEDEQKAAPPIKHSCGHPNHWEWGSGTRNGQKLYYPLEEMFYQKWHLTKKELNAAVKEYDMASIEVSNRIICKNCAVKTTKREY